MLCERTKIQIPICLPSQKAPVATQALEASTVSSFFLLSKGDVYFFSKLLKNLPMSRLVVYAATLRIPEKKSCLCIAFIFPPLETLSLSLSLSRYLGNLLHTPRAELLSKKQKWGEGNRTFAH
jgi:hypothetical protein